MKKTFKKQKICPQIEQIQNEEKEKSNNSTIILVSSESLVDTDDFLEKSFFDDSKASNM